MLDGEEAKLTKTGTVTVRGGRVVVKGFEGDGCGCREVAALGMLWAIGELQRQLMATLERPGGGDCVIG